MTDLEKEILTMYYNNYKETHSSHATYKLFTIPYDERKKHLSALEMLDARNYINIIHYGKKEVECEILPAGCDMVCNNFTDITPLHIQQGNNSICITGYNNSVSNCYSTIIDNISASSIPDEDKKLLKQLIVSLQEPSITEQGSLNKIKETIIKITSDMLSKTTVNSLTTLISELLKQII